MRNRIFDLHLPGNVYRCHVNYCAFDRLPFRKAGEFGDFRLLYLLKGTGRYSDERHDETPLTPGSFLLRRPGHRHVIERLAGESWLEFALVLPKGLYLQLVDLGVLSTTQLLYHLPLTVQVRHQLQELFDNADGLTIDQSGKFLHDIHGLLLAGTADKPAGEPVPHVPESIRNAMDILAKDPSVSMTMPSVAQEIGMGYHAFRKAFTKHVGHSPKEYRIRRVIEKAQDLLMEPDYRICDIAFDLGYPDQHTFSKQFKRVTGQSPSAFRET